MKMFEYLLVYTKFLMRYCYAVDVCRTILVYHLSVCRLDGCIVAKR